MSTPEQAAAAADRLAEVTAVRWRLEAAQRRIVTPAPATVRWRWAADDLTAPRREVTTPPAPGTGPPPLPDLRAPGKLLESGVVTRLHDEVYARLPQGRLILLGPPGAGKTGAMILLLLAALDRRASAAGGQSARVPVPVWLTMGGWNPATTALHEWATATMNRDHPALRAPDYGRDAAGELLRSGRVALFLDGLDELPDGLRTRALQRIDQEARGLRVVLTTRPEEYRNALQAGKLDNTAVIELRPVRPAAAAAYLLNGQAGPGRQRWEQLSAIQKQHPASAAAQALDNPLNLSLARDTYASMDPVALTDPGRYPTVEAIRAHLIEQLLITAYPSEHQRVRTTRWLAWIAHQMGTSRDLPWWHIPTWIPRWQLRLSQGLVVGLAGGLVFGLVFGLWAGLGLGLAGGLAVGLAGGLVFGLAGGHVSEPSPLAPRRPRPRELGPILAVGLAVGFSFVQWSLLDVELAVRFVGVFPGVLTVGRLIVFAGVLVVGLAGGFTGVLATRFLRMWSTPIAGSSAANAAATYRADRRTSLIYGLTLGLPLGLGFGLQFGLGFVPAVGPAGGLAVGLAVGLTVGLGGVLAGQAPQVKLAELALICQGRGTVHLLRLLQDASGRQVLRQAGAVYQFRHAALQDHVAAMYATVSGHAVTGTDAEAESRLPIPQAGSRCDIC